jgi:hypothetical protein
MNQNTENFYRVIAFNQKKDCSSLIVGMDKHKESIEVLVEDIAFISSGPDDVPEAFTIYIFGRKEGCVFVCSDVDEKYKLLIALNEEVYDFSKSKSCCGEQIKKQG